MYSKAKACVRVGSNVSPTFRCTTGVRQGDNLSPLLFAIFVNDFEEHLRKHCTGLSFAAEQIRLVLSDEDVEVFLKLYTLLYADDTILLAETESDLERSIDTTIDYCSLWDLKINISKTKIMVFSKGKITKIRDYRINGVKLEKVDEFRYLGVIFRYNGSFQSSIRYNVTKANKALFSLYKTMIKYDLSVENTSQLYDRLILPILLYGCEVWGYENLVQIEVFHRKFLRKLLVVHKKIPNCMVYGELGRCELKFTVWRRMISFWLKLHEQKNKYSSVFSDYMSKSSNCLTFKWITKIKTILNHSGISWVYSHPELCKNKQLNDHLKSYFNDLAQQLWNTEINHNRLCNSYKYHKSIPTREKYLTVLGFKDRRTFAKFRCADINFPHVRSLYANETLTVCPLCDSECIPDEYHLLLKCERFNYARAEFIPRHLYINPSLSKFKILMNSEADILISVVKLCGFILSFL